MSKIIFWTLCATILFLPLPYGSVEPWSIFIFEAVTLILFGLHLVARMGSKQGAVVNLGAQTDISESDSYPLILKIFLAFFFAVTVFQIIPLPPVVVKFLSPQAGSVSQDLGGQPWSTLSLSPSLTAPELLKYVCYFFFAFLIFRHVHSRRQIEIFVWVIMAGAVFQSLYGLAEYFGGTHRIFGWENIYYKDSVFGSFVNRNHFAGFLEMSLPVSIGYLLAKADFFAMKKELTLKEKILWFGQERLLKTLILAFVPIVLGVGLLFSRSRGGIFNFFVSMFFMMTVTSVAAKADWTHGKIREMRSRLMIRTVFLFIVFSALLIGIRPILARFSPDHVRGEVRPILYKNTLDLIGHYPFFGTGPGTYIFAYPRYEKIGTSSLIDHAHNDYLELFAESGIIAGGCLVLSALGALFVIFIRWTKRRDYFVKGITLGCLGGIVAILIHSVGDFNLRIPAIAVYFTTLYSLALATVRLKHQGLDGD